MQVDYLWQKASGFQWWMSTRVRPLLRRQVWGEVMRDLRRRNLHRTTCRSPRSCCRRLGGRPPRPCLRCRGALQKTCRRRFRPIVCRRVNRRSVRVRIVCLMCHHYRRLIPIGKKSSTIQFWGSQYRMPALNRRRGRSPHYRYLYTHGRRGPQWWWTRSLRLFWAPRNVICSQQGWHGLCPKCGRKSQDDRFRNTGLSVQISGVRRTPVYRWKPGVWLATTPPALPRISGSPGVSAITGPRTSYCMEEMGKERAMVAAATLQRDAGVMLSNLQILSQFAMALNQMSFSMMALGLDRLVFPGAEVDALSPAPRARRAAPYMSAMGLWRPHENPSAPRPAPTPSCNLCRNW